MRDQPRLKVQSLGVFSGSRSSDPSGGTASIHLAQVIGWLSFGVKGTAAADS